MKKKLGSAPGGDKKPGIEEFAAIMPPMVYIATMELLLSNSLRDGKFTITAEKLYKAFPEINNTDRFLQGMREAVHHVCYLVQQGRVDINSPAVFNNFKLIVDFLHGKGGITATDFIVKLPENIKNARNYCADKGGIKKKNMPKFESASVIEAIDRLLLLPLAKIFSQFLNQEAISDQDIRHLFSGCLDNQFNVSIKSLARVQYGAINGLINFYDKMADLETFKHFVDVALEGGLVDLSMRIKINTHLARKLNVKNKAQESNHLIEIISTDLDLLKASVPDAKYSEIFRIAHAVIAQNHALNNRAEEYLNQNLKLFQYCEIHHLVNYLPIFAANIEQIGSAELKQKYFDSMIVFLRLSDTARQELSEWFAKGLALQGDVSLKQYQDLTQGIKDRTSSVGGFGNVIDSIFASRQLWFYVVKGDAGKMLDLFEEFDVFHAIEKLNALIYSDLNERLVKFFEGFVCASERIEVKYSMAQIHLDISESSYVDRVSAERHFAQARKYLLEANQLFGSAFEFDTNVLVKLNKMFAIKSALRRESNDEFIKFLQKAGYESIEKLQFSCAYISQLFALKDLAEGSCVAKSEKDCHFVAIEKKQEAVLDAPEFHPGEALKPSADNAALLFEIETPSAQKVAKEATYDSSAKLFQASKKLSPEQIVHAKYQAMKKELKSLIKQKILDNNFGSVSWTVQDKVYDTKNGTAIKFDDHSNLYAAIDESTLSGLDSVTQKQFKNALSKGLAGKFHGANGIKKVQEMYELKIHEDVRMIPSKSFQKDDGKTLFIFDRVLNHSKASDYLRLGYAAKSYQESSQVETDFAGHDFVPQDLFG